MEAITMLNNSIPNGLTIPIVAWPPIVAMLAALGVIMVLTWSAARRRDNGQSVRGDLCAVPKGPHHRESTRRLAA